MKKYFFLSRMKKAGYAGFFHWCPLFIGHPVLS